MNIFLSNFAHNYFISQLLFLFSQEKNYTFSNLKTYKTLNPTIIQSQ